MTSPPCSPPGCVPMLRACAASKPPPSCSSPSPGCTGTTSPAGSSLSTPASAAEKRAAVLDWPAVIAALGSSLPCSGGEQRLLKITASLADGIPVDLRDTLTGLDDSNIQLLITAIRHASGKSF